MSGLVMVAALAAALAPGRPTPGELSAVGKALGDAGVADVRVARADLNGDGRPELVAYVQDRDYCGSGGCVLVVLTPDARGGNRMVMRATVSRPPVRLLPTSDRGWRDLSVAIGGGGARAGSIRLRFDGRRYPSNPTLAPRLPPASAAHGALLIDDAPR